MTDDSDLPPDADEIDRLVEEWFLGRWKPAPRGRVEDALGVVHGQPGFSLLVDHLERHANAKDACRATLALAVAARTMVRAPLSTMPYPMRDALKLERDLACTGRPYAVRADRLALDLVIRRCAARHRADGPQAVWDEPSELARIAVEMLVLDALLALVKSGVRLETGPLPMPANIGQLAARSSRAVYLGRCTCGGGRKKPLCFRPEEHDLRRWDPFVSTLTDFVHNATVGPENDGRSGLRAAA